MSACARLGGVHVSFVVWDARDSRRSQRQLQRIRSGRDTHALDPWRAPASPSFRDKTHSSPVQHSHQTPIRSSVSSDDLEAAASELIPRAPKAAGELAGLPPFVRVLRLRRDELMSLREVETWCSRTGGRRGGRRLARGRRNVGGSRIRPRHDSTSKAKWPRSADGGAQQGEHVGMVCFVELGNSTFGLLSCSIP